MSSHRDHRYGAAKKRLYLEPPRNGSETIRRRVTTIIPAPAPPCPPPVIVEPCPPPPPLCLPPPPKPAEPETIDVIAVDVAPSERSSKSSRSRSRGRRASHDWEREREVYVERQTFVPVRVQPEYETYRYVEGPRRPPAPSPPRSPPPRRRSVEGGERINILIEDRHREREYSRR